MDVNTTILVISILVAFSGWAKFLYDIFTRNPKIHGRIFNVIVGGMSNPKNQSEKYSAFAVYLYLTNERKNTVQILEYELEIECDNIKRKMERAYGVQTVKDWRFSSDKHNIDIPNFNEKLIYAYNKPVEYGIPLHGFVLFVSREEKYYLNVQKADLVKYHVTLIDVLGKKHRIVTSQKEFANINLLQDIAGIRLTELQ